MSVFSFLRSNLDSSFMFLFIHSCVCGGGVDVCVGGGKGGFVHKQVDVTVCNKKCYPSLKLSMSTFLSFTPYPHSPSLTFNQLPSLSHSLYLHSAGSLTHSILTFPFSQFTFPITPSHTISLLTLPHPTFTLPRVTLHTYYFPKILFQFSVKRIIVKC